MKPEHTPVISVPLGPGALAVLASCVAEAQEADPFARVVVVTAHRDAASSVRHLLGASNVLNVTVQTGERLAADLARLLLRPPEGDGKPGRQALNRLHESRAVRQVADGCLEAANLNLSAVGRRRLYSELTNAFRQWEQRPALDETSATSPAAGLDFPALYARFRTLVDGAGYYTRFDLPSLAAQALPDYWADGAEPSVIYYLPKHPTAGEMALMQALLERGKCRVIIGLTGDVNGGADGPALELYRRLTGEDAPQGGVLPWSRAVTDGALSITVAPDPVEEVRMVVRRIIAVSEDLPFHRIAVIHRQESPYASLLRQELDFAAIPSSGVPRRALADTGAGRLLMGALALVTSMDTAAGPNAQPSIDREQFIDLIMSCAVRFPPSANTGQRRRVNEIPATQWANLARAARADGTVDEWRTRLTGYIEQQSGRVRERDGDVLAANQSEETTGTGRFDGDVMVAFLEQLAPRLWRLRRSTNSDWTWQSAADELESLLDDYLYRTDGDEGDYQRVKDILGRLTGLADWDVEYDADDLRGTIGDELRAPVADRGRPVGSGVYVGPPAGVVGSQYTMVFAVGMVEGQFPPSQHMSIVDEWRDGVAAAQTRRALERYEFLGAAASASRVVLSYPVAGADRRMAYPSPWLLEAANLLHQATSAVVRLTSESLAVDGESKPWLTLISSRERGLWQLVEAFGESAVEVVPADLPDYNLVHLLANDQASRATHPAWATDPRVLKALEARAARMGESLTEWDGGVGRVSPRITEIGEPVDVRYAVSASSLETWSTCPYRYFLKYVLRVSAPPAAGDEDEISALDRGILVHRILETFAEREMKSEDELIALANAEFDVAGSTGITGYPLIWEMEKETIRAGLRRFFSENANWLGEVREKPRFEESFDDVRMEMPGLGTVRFIGKIDRLDVLASGEVRVHDFKTGDPGKYFVGPRGGQPDYTVKNGRALQLPVYAARARQLYNNADITASYCFPLHETRIFDLKPYNEADGLGLFHETMLNILGTARAGVFPATPEEGEQGNCHYCDFNRLCPTRRRQIWERKGRSDGRVQPFNALGGPAAIKNDDQ